MGSKREHTNKAEDEGDGLVEVSQLAHDGGHEPVQRPAGPTAQVVWMQPLYDASRCTSPNTACLVAGRVGYREGLRSTASDHIPGQIKP